MYHKFYKRERERERESPFMRNQEEPSHLAKKTFQSDQ